MTEADLLSRIQQLVPGSAAIDQTMTEQVFRGPGAYALILHLATPVPFARRGIAGEALSGWYVYAGSARGSGGMRARLRRHLRPDKPVHWHVDELTNAAVQMAALAVPNGSECEIVDRLLRSNLFTPAVRGFGSSDCKRCMAHLLKPVLADERTGLQVESFVRR